jgi:hypothetical protein
MRKSINFTDDDIAKIKLLQEKMDMEDYHFCDSAIIKIAIRQMYNRYYPTKILEEGSYFDVIEG